MRSKETARDFHYRFYRDPNGPGQFTVYRLDELKGSVPLPRTFRDFYKITLLTDTDGILAYSDQTCHIKVDAITLFNPLMPYSWQPISAKASGYSCLFTEDFIDNYLKSGKLAESHLFKVDSYHVLFPDKRTVKYLVEIFERMIDELNSPYVYKYELLLNHIQILLHEALKIAPAGKLHDIETAPTRICSAFFHLLERQFPLSTPDKAVSLKNANEFAARLGIHTNHLNRILKQLTGKTTTALIAEKFTKEAKALLLHSEWSIAEISFCLGYGQTNNFHHFFKNNTGITPSQFKRQNNTSQTEIL